MLSDPKFLISKTSARQAILTMELLRVEEENFPLGFSLKVLSIFVHSHILQKNITSDLIYLCLLTKCEGHTGGILALGLDSKD